MLKINLLPPYIYEKRKVRRAAFLFGLLFIVCTGIMVAWWAKLGNQERDLTAQVTDMEQKAQQVAALKQQVAAEQSKIPPIQEKVAFIESLMDYNLKYPKLYEELAKYTYGRILYSSVQPTATGLTVQAHARTIGDCGRYLLNMYRASHLFTSVTISAVPGWPAESTGGNQNASNMPGFDFTVTCALAQPINPPAYAAGAPGTTGVTQSVAAPLPLTSEGLGSEQADMQREVQQREQQQQP